MKLCLTIHLHGWWHSGTGQSGAGDVDAVVARDDDGLPFVPGKKLKGLLRDAAELCSFYQREEMTPKIDLLFGRETPGDPLAIPYDDEGALRFGNARPPEAFVDWVRSLEPRQRGELNGLFDVLAATAMKEGVARPHSLRKIEVALPMLLEATISWDDRPDTKENAAWHSYLDRCARLTRRLGAHRHRGLGRCHIRVELSPPPTEPITP